MRAYSAAWPGPHSAKRGLTFLRVYADAFGTSEVRVRLRLALLDVVGRHIARPGLRYASARECFRGVDVCGWIWRFVGLVGGRERQTELGGLAGYVYEGRKGDGRRA
jgi:hypothetical protein